MDDSKARKYAEPVARSEVPEPRETRDLVAGGAGYIGGSHLCKELLRQGHQPIIYDNLETGHGKATQHARFIEGNLADSKKLREAFKSFSVGSIMHFAADCQVGESIENPLKYFNNNVKNSLQLVEMMMEFNIRKLIFSSSAAVYGEPNKLPIPEEHPCLPANPNILTFRVL